MVAKSRSASVGQARLSSSGQVTIPVAIRRELGIDTGDTVIFLRDRAGAIRIEPLMTIDELSKAFSAPSHMSDTYASVSELIDEMDRTPLVRDAYRTWGEPRDSD